MTQLYKELDVRPILRNGGEPFPAIMEAVKSLGEGEGLRLVATFKPVPLFSVMAKRGFTHEARELGDGEWEILFAPEDKSTMKVAISAGAETAVGWPDPLWRLDLTGLEAPEPMAKVLSRIALMEPGEVLFSLFSEEPVFLMPELEKHGHQWVGNHDADRKAYRMLIRIGDATH